MKYREELLWILDKTGEGWCSTAWDERLCQQCIAFVHSLGLKCDSVGWCRMDLKQPQTGEIFEKIAAFCKEQGWLARCIYTRRYEDVAHDWFELDPVCFKDNVPADCIDTTSDQGEAVSTRVIRACYELSVGPKTWGKDIFAPERFRDCCIREGLDLDFCWAKDVGKYDAEQYFHVYGNKLIPRIAVDFGLKKSKDRIQEAGGWLPQIESVFQEIQMVDLQDCYLSEDMPEGGIVYGYIPESYTTTSRNTILIHKDVAQALLKEKAIAPSALKPAAVVDALPGGYVLRQTQPLPRPSRVFMGELFLEYKALKARKRPERMISEKEALKFLRKVKREYIDEFKRPMSRALALERQGSEYGPMIPYYLIANGGHLSNEYELLSYEDAALENEHFHNQLQTEELLEAKPVGIVIGKCPDGDVILLSDDGTVIRFSHEEPVIIEQWSNLEQFIVDAIDA